LFVCDYLEERTDFEEQKSKDAIDKATKLAGAQANESGLAADDA
jgi:hypothetical protein